MPNIKISSTIYTTQKTGIDGGVLIEAGYIDYRDPLVPTRTNPTPAGATPALLDLFDTNFDTKK